jgi:hypothetical protein
MQSFRTALSDCADVTHVGEEIKQGQSLQSRVPEDGKRTLLPARSLSLSQPGGILDGDGSRRAGQGVTTNYVQGCFHCLPAEWLVATAP